MEDPHGNAPLIANSQTRLLIGYERELKKNFTVSGQFYLEHTKNYASLLAANPLSKALIHENRQVITLRLSYLTMQQKLRYTLFNFYSPTDDDGYLKPSVNYRYSDQWSYALGANIFYGKNKHSFFGQHQQNSNIWLRVKAQF